MSLNIAVTGLNAATTDLNVISDNIANVNTTGFKSSRAEFGDMVSQLANESGMGVRLIRSSQSFAQGSIVSTDRTFDLAISKNGFFRLSTDSGILYSRSGIFSTTDAQTDPVDGKEYSYIVNNLSQNLTGYGVDVVDAKSTTAANFALTLNGNASIPTNTTFDPTDITSYNYQTSLKIYDSLGYDHNLKTYFVKTATDTWDTYNVLDNLPAKQSTTALNFSTTPIGGATQPLTFTAAELGDSSGKAVLSPTLDFSGITQGIAFSTTGITQSDGTDAVRSIGSDPRELLRVDLSNMAAKRTSSVDLGLNLGTTSPLEGASTLVKYDLTMANPATWPPATFSTSLEVYDSLGENHTLTTIFTPTGTTNQWTITHTLDGKYSDGNTTPPTPDPNAGTWTFNDVDAPTAIAGSPTSITFSQAVIGTGASDLVLDLDFDRVKVGVTGVASSVNNLMATNSTADPGTIDPSDPANYTYSSVTTVYDSLGKSHIMNLYYRQISDNNWSVYSQFPDINVSEATKVGSLMFDSRGALVRVTDTDGIANPTNPLSMSVIGIKFSGDVGQQNIALNFGDTTQLGTTSSTNSMVQNGYSSGALSDISPDNTGMIIATYDNGKTQIMGQVALSRFGNNEGLKRVGDNNWVETTESGISYQGKPATGLYGKLVTNALEGSNVDLTQQLVNMISAQRNFQANAQVITTNSTLYQSILGATR